jgi:hypothetical protein
MAGSPEVGRHGSSGAPLGSPARPSGRALASVAVAVLRRPDLWWTALGALRRLAAPGWWSTGSHLPVPDARLWAFRMVTAYGRPDAVPTRGDVISYLEWCRATARPRRPGREAEVTWSPTDRLDPSRSG